MFTVCNRNNQVSTESAGQLSSRDTLFPAKYTMNFRTPTGITSTPASLLTRIWQSFISSTWRVLSTSSWNAGAKSVQFLCKSLSSRSTASSTSSHEFFSENFMEIFNLCKLSIQASCDCAENRLHHSLCLFLCCKSCIHFHFSWHLLFLIRSMYLTKEILFKASSEWVSEYILNGTSAQGYILQCHSKASKQVLHCRHSHKLTQLDQVNNYTWVRYMFTISSMYFSNKVL